MSEAPEEFPDVSAVLGSFSPNATHLALLNDRPKLRLIDLTSSATTWELKLDWTDRPRGITYNSTGSLIDIEFVGKYDTQSGYVLLVSAETEDRLPILQMPGPGRYVDSSQMAFTCYDQVITIHCDNSEQRYNVKNPYTTDHGDNSGQLGPCNVFGTIQGRGRDAKN